MPGINYKVSLDSSGLNTGLKSIGGVQSALGSLSALMRGDFVGAAMQARNAFIALKAAMLANPFVAVVAAIAAVGAALAAVAWRRHQADIEAVKKATEDLADATERYNKTVKDIAFKRADDTGKLKMLQGERDRIAFDLEVQRTMPTDGKEAYELHKQAQIKRLEAELAVKDDQIREVRDRIAEEQKRRSDEQAKAQKEHDARIAAAESRRDELSAEYRRAKGGYTDRDRERDLIQEIIALEKDAAATHLGRLSRAEKEIALLEKKIELQRLQNRLAAKPADTPKPRAAREDADARKMASVRKAEAEYAFSKLAPEQQLAAIDTRMKEIMGKAGWEKDANARAEMLDLRKRRDDIEDAKKKSEEKKHGVGKQARVYRTVEEEARIDLLETIRQRRAEAVIRMRNSRAGGFIDKDGVRRMTGSLAGGFSDRLRPTAFARSAAELEAKRRGMAEAGKQIVAKTGEEQPVEIKGEAVTYLRIMAGALGKEA